MNQALIKIRQFNKKAGLLKDGYSDERECAFPIEEALEGFDLIDFSDDIKSEFMAPRDFSSIDPKDVSRAIIRATGERNINDVDRFDKHLDIIVFSIGSLYKLGLNSEQIARGLNVVVDANEQKLNAGKDSAGKQMKPDGFIPPEPQLQAILDERY